MKPLPPNTVIHVPTKELDQQVCKIFDDAGLKFASGNSYLKRNRWPHYEDQTCYNPTEGQYGNIKTYERDGFTILPASEFIKMNEVDEERELLEDYYRFLRPNENGNGLIDQFLYLKRRRPSFSLICADGVEVNDPEQIVWVLTSRGYSPRIAKEVADGTLKAFSTEQAANIYNKKTILEKNGISKEDCELIFRNEHGN